MPLKPILAFAHALLEEAVAFGDTVIDCTMGRGSDTLFLRSLVGESGRVFAFDIQEQAIEHTKTRLKQQNLATGHIHLIQASHADAAAHIPAEVHGSIRAAVFNLGYLPGGDKGICTAPHTTIAALKALPPILAPGGIIVLVVYPGHPAGEVEAFEVLEYCRGIPREEMQVVTYQIWNNPNRPPFVIALEKKQ